MVSGALGGPLEASPLLNLCNLLCSVRPGQLGRGQWPRRGISAISKNFSEILEISRNTDFPQHDLKGSGTHFYSLGNVFACLLHRFCASRSVAAV